MEDFSASARVARGVVSLLRITTPVGVGVVGLKWAMSRCAIALASHAVPNVAAPVAAREVGVAQPPTRVGAIRRLA